MTSTDATSSASSTSDAVHPRIAELLVELDAARAELLALVASLTPEQRNAPAVGDAWSVAQILEHLTMVENGGGRLVSKIVQEVETLGQREESTSSVLGMNDEYQIATSNVRVTAPEWIRPTAGLSPEESMARLAEMREKLKSVLRRASGLALEGAAMPHPLFGPFNGYQWALATAQHERRHTRQIRRLVGQDS